MPIHTRAEVYSKEATQLLQEISMYPGVLEQQLIRFHPGKDNIIKGLLSQLIRQGRIRCEQDSSYYINGFFVKCKDYSMMKAVWVLLDFLDHVEYHSASDFPVKLVFFIDGEEYEVICVPQGQEVLINQAMHHLKEEHSRRIVIIDSPDQISALDFPSITAFCIVDLCGTVKYYRLRKGDSY